eukprot:GHVN01016188.1.p1 GENE.GHVN01016188.1~~GHVN01016188.1.p1  ORF type:complete len:392 (-),score=79.09 GHVN01016188.1:140-1315(-)
MAGKTDFEKLATADRTTIVDTVLAEAKKALEINPGNRCAKYIPIFLSTKEAEGLSDDEVRTFYKCVRTGIENPDSDLGCYAMRPVDYEKFRGFFDLVIRDYHADETGQKKHESSWDASAIGEKGVLDVRKLGFNDELSMRVRVGRNLKAFNLPGAMDRGERVRFEKTMLKAFDALIADPNYGGCVYSLSLDLGEEMNPNLINQAKYKQLVDKHVMFKEMDKDPYLLSAGIASDWPYGRGCWQSRDQQCIIWFGEEDQLRIMCMKNGYFLNEVFDRLKTMLDKVESIDGIEFATNSDYGYVTSCPSNLGTGMRASVHVKLPNLTKGGSDKKAKEICTPLGLSLRGTGGEHTPIGADGTVDISPRARLFIKESEIIEKLYEGIRKLMEKEKSA